jgi:hypothetical protein
MKTTLCEKSKQPNDYELRAWAQVTLDHDSAAFTEATLTKVVHLGPRLNNLGQWTNGPDLGNYDNDL